MPKKKSRRTEKTKTNDASEPSSPTRSRRSSMSHAEIAQQMDELRGSSYNPALGRTADVQRLAGYLDNMNLGGQTGSSDTGFVTSNPHSEAMREGSQSMGQNVMPEEGGGDQSGPSGGVYTLGSTHLREGMTVLPGAYHRQLMGGLASRPPYPWESYYGGVHTLGSGDPGRPAVPYAEYIDSNRYTSSIDEQSAQEELGPYREVHTLGSGGLGGPAVPYAEYIDSNRYTSQSAQEEESGPSGEVYTLGSGDLGGGQAVPPGVERRRSMGQNVMPEEGVNQSGPSGGVYTLGSGDLGGQAVPYANYIPDYRQRYTSSIDEQRAQDEQDSEERRDRASEKKSRKRQEEASKRRANELRRRREAHMRLVPVQMQADEERRLERLRRQQEEESRRYMEALEEEDKRRYMEDDDLEDGEE